VVDTALLDLIERLCHAFQRLTGRTNVWLAVQLTNLSIIVYFVWAGVYFWTIDDLSARFALVLFCSGLLYLLSQTIFKESIEMYESNAYRRVAKGVRNPRRLRDALMRTLFLSLSLVLAGPVVFGYRTLHLTIILLSYSLIVLTTLVLYLLACDPLPPCPGKVREWLRSLAPSRAVPETDTSRVARWMSERM
jgi:hypothetical protein